MSWWALRTQERGPNADTELRLKQLSDNTKGEQIAYWVVVKENKLKKKETKGEKSNQKQIQKSGEHKRESTRKNMKHATELTQLTQYTDKVKGERQDYVQLRNRGGTENRWEINTNQYNTLIKV